jgi:hypothetical protein
MLVRISEQRDRIDPATLVQNVRWAPELEREVSHV